MTLSKTQREELKAKAARGLALIAAKKALANHSVPAVDGGHDRLVGWRLPETYNGGVSGPMVGGVAIEACVAALPDLLSELDRMEGALRRIEKWFGEFPETGMFWPNEDGSESDRPMSYSAAWGSNGERDFMRSIARAALNPEPKP